MKIIREGIPADQIRYEGTCEYCYCQVGDVTEQEVTYKACACSRTNSNNWGAYVVCPNCKNDIWLEREKKKVTRFVTQNDTTYPTSNVVRKVVDKIDPVWFPEEK